MVTTADPTKNGKITQTAIYNAKGELIAAADGEATPEVYYYNGDASYKSYWFIFDDVLYSTNTLDGSILKIADVPEYMTLPYVTDESENYYYYIGQSDVKIYDKQFKLVSEWAYPSFATFKYGINLLNNGNIVAQYSVRLPEDAAEYDVLSNGNKYDLVTVIVSPADASEKELNADFIIHDVETSYASKLFYGVSLYADGVENVATVSYIEDNKINTSVTGNDFVIISNELETGDSVKLAPGQESIPYYAGNGYYIAPDYPTYMYFDKDGKLVVTYDSSNFNTSFGNYVVSSSAIYNQYTMEKVYDLEANKASIYRTLGDTAVIMTSNDDESEGALYLFIDGEAKLLATSVKQDNGSYIIKDASGKEISSIEAGSGYYYIKNTDGSYDYFNSRGEKIATAKNQLNYVSYKHIQDGFDIYSVVIMQDSVSGKYCFFS